MEAIRWHSGLMERTTAEIRHFEKADRAAVLGLASRLLVGVAPWRDQDAAARAVESWVAGSVDAADPAHAPVLVAVEDGHVVGFVTTGTRGHWCGEIDAYVGELVVAERFAARGVGRALLTAAESWARLAGHRRLTIETGAANRGARAFYHAAGYSEEEVVLSRAL